MNLKHLFVAVPTALCITPTTEARVSGCLLGNRANGEGFLGLAPPIPNGATQNGPRAFIRII